MKKKLSIFVVLISLIAVVTSVYAQEDADLFFSAKQSVKNGNRDFAFMQFHSLLRLSKSSFYHQEALFATGEYYFDMANYFDAYTSFSKLIELYPKSEALPFAIVYLLKMEQMHSQDSEYDLKKKVITFKQISLLFSEYKEYLYESPLGLKYKAIYFIDRVEVYINEAIFETVYF